jgi:hypothetical protein
MYPSLDRAKLVQLPHYQVLAPQEKSVTARKQLYAHQIQLPKIVASVTELDRVWQIALTSELPIHPCQWLGEEYTLVVKQKRAFLIDSG